MVIIKRKWIMPWMALFCCLLMSLHANAYNKLSIPDVLVAPGGNIELPVNLDNDDQIVALQFTLTVPDGVTIDASASRLTNRCSDHMMRVKNMQGNDYLCMIYSVNNTALSGNQGAVMYLALHVSNEVNAGETFPLTINEAVASDANMNNLLSESSAGSITIATYPDLTALNVTTDKQHYAPGDHMVISWLVQNVGQLATEGGWSEQLTLVTEDGTTCFLTTAHYQNNLAANGTVSRQADIIIPQVPGIHGNVKPQVHIVPNSDCGERPEAQANNTAIGSSIELDPLLYLSISKSLVEETDSKPLNAVVTRSGDRQGPMVVSITCNDSRLTIPPSVTIEESQSSASFTINVTDNDVVDDNDKATITAHTNGYPAANAILTIEDNEFPPLTLELSQREITEGETVELTVTIPKACQQALTVSIKNDQPERFNYDSNVIIPAGSTSATIVVATIDDNNPALDQEVTFLASCEGYEPDEAWLTLHDNDLPTMELTLTPATVSESSGPNAIVAKLRRLDHTDSDITITITDASQGDLYYTKSINMAAGVTEVQFMIGVVDNAIAEGDRSINVTAAIYIKACSCSAQGGSAGSISQPLTITDNDGPALTVVSSRSTITEGEETILTITRNTSVNEPLQLTLNSNHDEILSYEHNVTIAAGETSITVPVTVTDSPQNDITVSFTAEATNYSSGTCWIMVTNNRLPDAQITDFSLSVDEANAGETVEATVVVTNCGLEQLTEATRIGIYDAQDKKLLTTLYTPKELAPGEEINLVKAIKMPDKTGVCELYAEVNDTRTVKESIYVNNKSATVSITLTSPFSATLTTNKPTYASGETVILTGALSGANVGNTTVEVYIIYNGYRHVINATTDANGNFSAEYTPFSAQAGHFVAGACYPGEKATAEMTSFEVFGLQRASTGYLTYDVMLNDPFDTSIAIENPNTLAQHNVHVNVISKPENFDLTFNTINVLEGGATTDLGLSITGLALTEKNEWQEAVIEVTSDEGSVLKATLYLYCRYSQAKIKPDITAINTTMTKGKSRIFAFSIMNIGKGSTGNITLSLPSWMRAETPMTMPAIDQGEEAQIVLQLVCTEDMPLNVPIKGSIAINPEHGEGVAIPYCIEPVSEENGTLLVDVTDCYTYNTAEAPHVQNASIVIKHPTTGAFIAEGVTGADGTFSIELPEGYYAMTVNAEKHNEYKETILVDPGRTNRKLVYLTFKGVSVSWEVVGTEIEDEYEITNTYTFETSVPEPVITIDGPKGVVGEDMGVGDSKLLYFIVTNRGLVSALQNRFIIPEDDETWAFKLLDYTEPFELSALQAVAIPVLITRLSLGGRDGSREGEGEAFKQCLDDCMKNFEDRYKILCPGQNLRDNASAYKLALKFCALACAANAVVGGGGGGGDNGGYNGPHYPNNPETVIPTLPSSYYFGPSQDICNPLVAERYEMMLDYALGLITPLGIVNTMVDISYEYEINHKIEWGEIGGLALNILRFPSKNELWNLASDIYDFYDSYLSTPHAIWDFTKITDRINNGEGNDKRTDLNSSAYDWMDEYDEYHAYMGQQFWFLEKALKELYADDVWYRGPEDNTMEDFWNQVDAMDFITYESVLPYKPMSVTREQLSSLVSRINNSYDGSTLLPRVNIDSLKYYCRAYLEYDKYAQENGYATMLDFFHAENEKYNAQMQEAAKKKCALVTLQISQHLVMTRQAFLGTLTVTNGHDTEAIQDAKLTLTIIDEDGKQATSHEFEVQLKDLQGFDGPMDLEGGWSLGAGKTGTATVLFIPTKYAAPVNERVYSFGGTLSYIDPFTGELITQKLFPDYLTVRPSPNLVLDYFMQRDIYGDDPLTEEVEPMEDAEFALIIDNQGYGDANNVTLVTNQPSITENESGLLIDFEFVKYQLNGEETSPTLGGSIISDFGTIEAHSQAYAQWWLRSTLLGHFIDYDVSYTHLTGYGNEDLSLIDEVRVHELIHGFTTDDVTGKQMRGFLVNDMPDANDMPDIIHFTNATQESVANSSATLTSLGNNQYALKVNSAAPGWNYGSVYDPTHGRQKILSIVRQSDNMSIYNDNMWTTDRTLRDGMDWLYENRLHYVVDIAGATETYIITFEQGPDLELAVQSIGNIPPESEILTEPLTLAVVTFNKPIDASTFTAQDITLFCQGSNVNVSTIGIEQVNDRTFNLDLTGLTSQNGYYVLTVQTAGIKDLENYYGSSGKQVSWLQFGGLIPLTIAAQPAQGGSVSPESGEFMYDDILHLNATPATGYRFLCWMAGDEVISYDNEVDYPLQDINQLTAIFEIIHCKVNINCNEEGGVVIGEETQVCDYGTVLTMTAEPTEGYVFNYWIVNGVQYSSSPELTITVDADMVIEAVFTTEDAPGTTVAPVISYEVTDDAVIITATGEGEVLLYVNGEPVDNPCIINRSEDDVTYIVTATAQAEGLLISETVTLEITVPAKEVTPPEPSVTPAPVISYEVTETTVIIAATGEGEVLLWIDGAAVDNPCPVARGEEDFTVIATATAQLPDWLVSETTTSEILIPKIPGGSSGANEIANGKEIKSIRYFNLLGQETREPNGPTIVVVTFTDGTSSVTKVMK